jgi:hypothetical protein
MRYPFVPSAINSGLKVVPSHLPRPAGEVEFEQEGEQGNDEGQKYGYTGNE